MVLLTVYLQSGEEIRHRAKIHLLIFARPLTVDNVPDDNKYLHLRCDPIDLGGK